MLFKGKQLRNLLFKGKFVVLFNTEVKLKRKKRSLCFTLSQTFLIRMLAWSNLSHEK